MGRGEKRGAKNEETMVNTRFVIQLCIPPKPPTKKGKNYLNKNNEKTNITSTQISRIYGTDVKKEFRTFELLQLRRNTFGGVLPGSLPLGWRDSGSRGDRQCPSLNEEGIWRTVILL